MGEFVGVARGDHRAARGHCRRERGGGGVAGRSSANRRRASADTSVSEAPTAVATVRSIALSLCDLGGACPPPHAPTTRSVHFPATSHARCAGVHR